MLDRPLLEAIASEALRRLQDFGCQDLSNTAWAFAKLTIRHGPLLEAIASAAIAHGSDEALILSSFVWALWRFGHHDDAPASAGIGGGGIFWGSARIDAMAVSYMLMDASWAHCEGGDEELWQFIVGSAATRSEAGVTFLPHSSPPSLAGQ